MRSSSDSAGGRLRRMSRPGACFTDASARGGLPAHRARCRRLLLGFCDPLWQTGLPRSLQRPQAGSRCRRFPQPRAPGGPTWGRRAVSLAGMLGVWPARDRSPRATCCRASTTARPISRARSPSRALGPRGRHDDARGDAARRSQLGVDPLGGPSAPSPPSPDELTRHGISIEVRQGAGDRDPPGSASSGPRSSTRCAWAAGPTCSSRAPHPDLRLRARALRARRPGERVLLAHTERCPAFQRDPDVLAGLVAGGMLSSITGASLTGDFGSTARRTALHLLREGLVHRRRLRRRQHRRAPAAAARRPPCRGARGARRDASRRLAHPRCARRDPRGEAPCAASADAPVRALVAPRRLR